MKGLSSHEVEYRINNNMINNMDKFVEAMAVSIKSLYK